MAPSSNLIILITKHRHDPRNREMSRRTNPLWADRRRVEPRASKSATDATAGIWRPHCHDVRSCRTAIPGAGIAPCLIGMDACVGAPHLSRNLKPTVTIRDWSPQNMTRVRFARKVQDYALARCGGKGQLWVTLRPNRRLHRCASVGLVLLHELTFCILRPVSQAGGS